MVQDIPVPAERIRKWSWVDPLSEGVFDLLFATEAGLVVFGVLAVGIGVPLLVVAAGAAWAARARRKRVPHEKAVPLGAAMLAPVVLLAVLGVLLLFGALSVGSFLTGHPVAMALSYAAALATLALVGYWAVQRRAARTPRP
jgi:hypothetical protein